MYVFGLLDMTYKDGKQQKPVVCGNTGLLKEHDNALLKKGFFRNPEACEKVADVLTEVFKGQVQIAEQEAEDEEKN